jgi:outer membrane protein OmpA-like peptidoglycan-associated protein
LKTHNGCSKARVAVVAAAVAALLAACASTPEAPAGSLALRSKLSQLKSEAQLAAQVPVMLDQAETAVKLAETPQRDAELTAHRIYLADRMIDTTRATAESRLAEKQRPDLRRQSDNERLAARTREADAARSAATLARADADSARDAATTARNEAEAARTATSNAASAAAAATAATAAATEAQRLELVRQIALLQARETDRGIVLTLGDVLFATGSDNLKPGAIGNLDRLVSFLEKYGDRSASIEGHTDSMGSDAYNQDLSLRRADSVKGYLATHGVASGRLSSIGKGESYPVAGNESAGGRQQNRRVEIVIANGSPSASVASAADSPTSR